MNIRKVFFPIIIFFSILLVLNVNTIKSNAYYDIRNDFNIPKGGEFVYDQFIFRVVKPETKNSFGLVEITGLNPEYDKPYINGQVGLFCV